jgi:hypothetical protein
VDQKELAEKKKGYGGDAGDDDDSNESEDEVRPVALTKIVEHRPDQNCRS